MARGEFERVLSLGFILETLVTTEGLFSTRDHSAWDRYTAVWQPHTHKGIHGQNCVHQISQRFPHALRGGRRVILLATGFNLVVNNNNQPEDPEDNEPPTAGDLLPLPPSTLRGVPDLGLRLVLLFFNSGGKGNFTSASGSSTHTGDLRSLNMSLTSAVPTPTSLSSGSHSASGEKSSVLTGWGGISSNSSSSVPSSSSVRMRRKPVLLFCVGGEGGLSPSSLDELKIKAGVSVAPSRDKTAFRFLGTSEDPPSMSLEMFTVKDRLWSTNDSLPSVEPMSTLAINDKSGSPIEVPGAE